MATTMSRTHSNQRRMSNGRASGDPMLLDSMGAYRSLTRMEPEPSITHTGPPPTGTPPISSHATKPFINDDILAERSTSEEVFIPSPRSGGAANPHAHAQITLTDLTPSIKVADTSSKKSSSQVHHRVLRLKPPRYAGLVPLPIKPFTARTARTAQKEMVHKKWWYQTHGRSSSIDGTVERVYVIPKCGEEHNAEKVGEGTLFEEVKCDQGLPASSKARRAMQTTAESNGPMVVVKPNFYSLFGAQSIASSHKITEQKARWIRLFPKLAHDEGKFKLKRLFFGEGNKPLYPKDSDAPDTFLGAFDCWTIHNGGRQWVSLFVTTNHICISTASGDVRDEVHFSNILSIRHCAVLENEENILGDELLTNITFGATKSTNSPNASARQGPRKISIGAAPQSTLSVRDFELSVAAMNLRQGDHSIMRRPQYDDIPTFVPIDEERKIPAANTNEEGSTLIPPSMAPLPPTKATKPNGVPKHFDPLSMYSPLIKPNAERPAAGEWLAHATESPLKNKRGQDSHSRIPSSPPMAIESPEPVMTSTTLRGVADGEADDFQVQGNETGANGEVPRGTHPIPFEQRPSYAANLKLQALLLSIMKSPDSDSSHRTSPLTGSNTPSPSKHSSQSPSLPSYRVPSSTVPPPPPPPPPAAAVQIFTRMGTVYHFWGLVDLTATAVGAAPVVMPTPIEPRPPTETRNVSKCPVDQSDWQGTPCSMCKALGFTSPTGSKGPATIASTEPILYNTPLTSNLHPMNATPTLVLESSSRSTNTYQQDGVSLTCPRCGNVGKSSQNFPNAGTSVGHEIPPSPTLLHIRHRHQQFETFDRLLDTTWRMCVARINGVEVNAVAATPTTAKTQQKNPKGPTPANLMSFACSPQLLYVNVLKSKIEYETSDGNIFTLESAKQGTSKNSSVSSRAAMGGSLGGSLTAVDRLLNRSGGVDGSTYKSASQTNRSALLSKMSFDNQNNQSKHNRSLGTSMLMSSSTARGSYNRKMNSDLQNGVVVKPKGNNKSISTSSSAGTAPYTRQSISEPPLTA